MMMRDFCMDHSNQCNLCMISRPWLADDFAAKRRFFLGFQFPFPIVLHWILIIHTHESRLNLNLLTQFMSLVSIYQHIFASHFQFTNHSCRLWNWNCDANTDQVNWNWDANTVQVNWNCDANMVHVNWIRDLKNWVNWNYDANTVRANSDCDANTVRVNWNCDANAVWVNWDCDGNKFQVN